MSNQRSVKLCVLLALLTALSVAAQRVHVEARHTKVALLADYGELTALAAFSRQSVPEVLTKLRSAGLTGVSVEEPALKELVDSGAVTVASEPAGLTAQGHERRGQAAVAHLDRRFGYRLGTSVPGVVGLAGNWLAVQDAGVGLDADAVKTVVAAKLLPVARLRNTPGLDLRGVETSLADAAQLGVKHVIFAGDQVLGFRGLPRETAAALVKHGLTWGRVEFAEQKGEDKLAEALLAGDLAAGRAPTSYLRVHSITAGEMLKLTPEMAVERYRRAAKERGSSLLFVRLLLSPSDDILETNARQFAALKASLAASGLHLGTPQPLPPMSPGRPRLAVIGVLGVLLPAASLVLLLTGCWSERRLWSVTLVASLPLLGLLVLKPRLYCEGLGLLAGLVYPTLAGRRAWRQLRHGAIRTRGQALALLWSTVGLAVVGALLAAGLQTDTRHMLHHNQFMGVKLTQIVPLAAVAVIVLTGLSLPGVSGRDARRNLEQAARTALLSWHIVVGAVVLVALAIFVARSGNEGLDVSSTELRFRALLEHLFGARPRTKEFLLGYPLLVLAAQSVRHGRPKLAGPLLLGGMIGVVSAFNTFCHLHTPLLQSLLRTFHGLWLGSLLGLLAGRLARTAAQQTAAQRTAAERADG